MTIESIGPDPAARDRAIAALTLAFIRDPMMRWLFPEPAAYLSLFPDFARAFGGRAFEAGTAWASDDQGGTALWMPRDVLPDGEAMAAYLLGSVDERKHDVLGKIFEGMEAHHPDEPHWYLAIVGVDAAHQGKGIGAKLVQVALERCDAEGLIAYLESSNPANVSLYERHGFEIAGEIRHGDAPPLIPMLRPAR